MMDTEKDMIQKETIQKYIMLAGIQGIGPIGQNALLDMENDINRLFEMSEEELMDADKDGGVGRQRISVFLNGREDEDNKNRAEKIYSDCENKGIRIIVKGSSDYPKRFAGIQDMPIILYANGSLRINDYTNSIGIIGTKRCSAEGKEKAISVATESVDDGSMIISGMAKGIDSCAQTAALKNAGYTIAVLGYGSDICYPKEHQALFETIAEQGCILSEYPPGTIPHRYMFPRRNRIIAGLSDSVYIIDAGRNSGTESTVEYCRKYGRRIEVFDGADYPDEDEIVGKVEEWNKGDCEEKAGNEEELRWEKVRISFELQSLEGEIKAHTADKELIDRKLEDALLKKEELEKRLGEIGE